MTSGVFVPAASATNIRSLADPPLQKPSSQPTHPWREPDSNHRSPEKETAVERGPQPTIVVSRDDLCLTTPSSLSVHRPPFDDSRETFRNRGTDGSNLQRSANFQSLSVMTLSLRCSGAMPCSDKLRACSAALRHLRLTCSHGQPT